MDKRERIGPPSPPPTAAALSSSAASTGNSGSGDIFAGLSDDHATTGAPAASAAGNAGAAGGVMGGWLEAQHAAFDAHCCGLLQVLLNAWHTAFA